MVNHFYNIEQIKITGMVNILKLLLCEAVGPIYLLTNLFHCDKVK